MEALKAEELRKLQRDKRVLEKQSRALLKLPTKREKEEIQALEASGRAAERGVGSAQPDCASELHAPTDVLHGEGAPPGHTGPRQSTLGLIAFPRHAGSAGEGAAGRAGQGRAAQADGGPPAPPDPGATGAWAGWNVCCFLRQQGRRGGGSPASSMCLLQVAPPSFCPLSEPSVPPRAAVGCRTRTASCRSRCSTWRRSGWSTGTALGWLQPAAAARQPSAPSAIWAAARLRLRLVASTRLTWRCR